MDTERNTTIRGQLLFGALDLVDIKRCVWVCVFVHATYSGPNFICEMRTFWLVFTGSNACLRVKTVFKVKVRTGFRSGVRVRGRRMH